MKEANDQRETSDLPARADRFETKSKYWVVLVVFVAGILAVLGGGTALVVWGMVELNREEVLPPLQRPDGQWTIEVSGHRLWNGSVEVVVVQTTSKGRTGRFVKGMEPSFTDFRKKYSNLQFRGDDAFFSDGTQFLSGPPHVPSPL